MSMAEKIIILGSGGHGKVCKELAEACGYEVLGFVGNNKPVGTKILDKKIISTVEDVEKLKSETNNIVIAIGANTVREKRAQQARDAGFEMPSLIHPSCVFSPSADVGIGTVIMGGTVVNAEAYIGDFCIINTGATVDHDCRIGDYCHISPGANIAGEVTIRDYTWVGVGAAVRELITIGKNVMIGGSAFVACDIEDNVTAIGVPAKVTGK
ncbi:MAG: acetyltransferase [Denitrovibrio sp.]|nr:MAG: acetyltransferase [Denitrovibrio sp.]